MRADLLPYLALASVATGHAIERRADLTAQAKKWHPITTNPSFFQLKVNVYNEDLEDTPAPINPAPVNPAPVNPAPVNPAPVNPAPVDPAPVDPAPVDPAPVDPAPVDPAPVNPAPVQPAPLDNTKRQVVTPNVPVTPDNSALEGYGIRLENYKVIATPYDRWYDPTVATFFVDDDTAMYTVSKDPLQMYINAQTGQFEYARVGWLPSNAIGLHFFHTGDSPLGTVGEGLASSFLTWPSTQGIVPGGGTWMFCPRGTENARTGTYEIFIDDENFPSSGVDKDTCLYANLVAANVNPWRKPRPHHHHDDHHHYDEDSDEDEKSEDEDYSYPVGSDDY